MSVNQEVRKLPTKTKVMFILIAIIGFGYYIVSTSLRDMKVEEYLAKVGFENVTEITVFSKKDVKDDQTNKKGILYSMEFKYNNQTCRGFILRNQNNEISKDIECK